MPLALGLIAIFLGVALGQFFGDMVISQIPRR